MNAAHMLGMDVGSTLRSMTSVCDGKISSLVNQGFNDNATLVAGMISQRLLQLE